MTAAGRPIAAGHEISRDEALGLFDRGALAAPAAPGGIQALLARKRVRLLLTLVVGALLPFALRALLRSGAAAQPSAINSLAWNAGAIVLAFWMRLSMESYPGIRRAYLLLFSATASHLIALAWFVFTREPYDWVALALGFVIHVLCLYAIFASPELRLPRRFAVVPFGRVRPLAAIREVDWRVLPRPRVEDARSCQAIVADFNADLPEEWEAFLAEAALAGRIVYQVKQLSESLTGRVELEHLSENNFGSLVPARGYFHLKWLADSLLALVLLPFVLPLFALVGIAILLDDGGPVFFRQKRVGYAGRNIVITKFRTMRSAPVEDERAAAMTANDDERVTRVGRFLRRSRLDELPQIFNILRGEMSWIGPRPEAAPLSRWYQGEIPFYRYRHVVKPGISGWAQVNQGHVAELEHVHLKLQYDFYYIKYFSPWLDLLILVRTIRTMLSGFGAR